MKLNLGAGKVDLHKDGYINHDISKHSEYIDIIWNCDIIPYDCFENNQFDEIRAISVIEHFRPNMIETLNELHRIIVPNGRLVLKYPIYSSETVNHDPTHVWTHWCAENLHYVDPTTKYGKEYDFYTDKKWRIIDLQVVKNRNVFAELRAIK